ncbi:hypothetical protein Tco_0972395 [Tanacetum coccineum]
MVRGEAMEASKRRRSMLDYIIQQLSKGSSEGSGIILKVPDEPKDNSDPINGGCSHSSRGPSCPKNSTHTVISMVTDKTTSTPTPPTTHAQVQMCSTSCPKDGF